MGVNDDAQLIDQTFQSAAFGQLVEKYQDRLFNTVVHVIGNAEDAKDVVQEAFVQAFLKLRTFHCESAFYIWLYRIAFNVAATHRHTTQSVDDGEGPTVRLEREERCRQVREAIADLNEEHRVVLVLREIDGCCYESIAEILDVPVGTVRSRLHRARLQLREQLKEVLAVEE